MITVVLTSFNGDKYIEEQLDSIRLQSIAPDEVIIIDDMSSDTSIQIITKYISCYHLNWRFIINEENLGYKHNFKKGIGLAKGDYIFLSDQDDIWEKNKIEAMLRVISSNTDIMALNCATSIIDVSGNKVKIQSKPNYWNSGFLYYPRQLEYIQEFDYRYLMKHNLTPGCAMCINRVLQQEFLQYYDFKIPHDWYLNILASLHSGCFFVNEPLIRYRLHASNTIGANTNFRKAIHSRTREFRVNDYKSQLETFSRAENIYEVSLSNECLSVHQFLIARIDFYKSPNPVKLWKLYRFREYKEVVKQKIRVWEILVSMNLDRLVIKLVGE